MLGGLAGLVGLSAVAGVLVTATVTPAIAVSGAAASSAITMFDNLPSVLDIDRLMLPTTLYAKKPDSDDYVELTQFYDQNRSPVEFDEITPVMYDAILSSEDPRYYQHGGVDLIGTTRAVLSNLRGGGETQGGSSISQQYVKNILVQRCEADAQTEEEKYECWTAATTAAGDEGIQRKLQEMRYAIALEQKYSKNEILLGYLNIANFGGTTYGIDAAARRYFGVSAADLSLAQAATLAGIVQNPNTYRIDMKAGSITNADGVGLNGEPDGEVDAAAGQLAALDNLLADGTIDQEQYLAAADGYTLTKGRQLYVLSRMLDDGKITRDQYVEAVIAPITPKITSPKTGCSAATGAEYYCQYVRAVIENDPAFGATIDERTELLRRGGLNVYTTLDWSLQKSATETMSRYAPSSIADMNFGSTSVSVEADTGRVLAIAQNTKFRDGDNGGDPNYSSIVYAGDLTHGGSIGFPAGSTFKLFTLLGWLEEGHSVNEVVNAAVRPPMSMTNTCAGNWVNNSSPLWKPNNFGEVPGYAGTPMQFTAQSLNSGFVFMAAELDLCEIQKIATKMGVTLGNGEEVPMVNANEVIGSDAISPLAIAGAYGTVANNGIYCEPKVIDKVVDPDGNELALPERSCEQVLDPAVAATAAYALQGVMQNGGTGSTANPRDGVPLIGKTGTHEESQTWVVESSTKVATAVWVGNSIGERDVFKTWANGTQVAYLRYSIAREIQGAANALYGGSAFPSPDSNLTRQVLIEMPNVVGMTVEEATSTLQNAGFQVIVGSAVDSDVAKGVVADQDPPGGLVNGGTVVTIFPSNGAGITVPDVAGRNLDRAISDLRRAGFGNVQAGTCTQSDDAGNNPQATGTSPAAGSTTNRNTAIVVDYVARDCGGDDDEDEGDNPGNGGGNG
ncbi:hypothetical protein GCM10022200_29920 [Microbacterium awajiense]|uniref:PASTA domain-containing protein n=1 Tax=Microbacterium awajiense TaxID=415214 RepID=A0ABP7B062_9MICO